MNEFENNPSELAEISRSRKSSAKSRGGNHKLILFFGLNPCLMTPARAPVFHLIFPLRLRKGVFFCFFFKTRLIFIGTGVY